MRHRHKNGKDIIRVIREIPGVTSHEITELLPHVKNVSAALSDMIRTGEIRREGESGSGRKNSGYKYYPVSTPPPVGSRVLLIPKSKPLSDYTPRELLEELKRRGYVWDKMWVVTKQYVEFNKI